MRPSVLAAFAPYSIKHEGYTPFMYCDTLNLVTTGIGNLIDASARNSTDTSVSAMAPALRLPWVHRVGNAPAMQQEVVEAWQKTKLAGWAKRGGFAYQHLTDLVLTDEAIADLVNERLRLNDAIVASRYPSYEQWPADAQFAIMSMAWAMGPAFHFPQFHAALCQDPPDFEEAAVQCFFVGGGSLTTPTSRNHQNAEMFRLADAAQKHGWDYDELRFPQ